MLGALIMIPNVLNKIQKNGKRTCNSNSRFENTKQSVTDTC